MLAKARRMARIHGTGKCTALRQRTQPCRMTKQIRQRYIGHHFNPAGILFNPMHFAATALQIAARRSSIPLIAVTNDRRTAQQLAVIYGVKSYVRPADALAATKRGAHMALSLERLGYRLTILIALLALVTLVEEKGWIVGAVFAVGFSLGSHYLFGTLLRVPLPQGPFGF